MKTHKKNCVVCSKEFTAKRSHATTCSTYCRGKKSIIKNAPDTAIIDRLKAFGQLLIDGDTFVKCVSCDEYYKVTHVAKKIMATILTCHQCGNTITLSVRPQDKALFIDKANDTVAHGILKANPIGSK